MRGGHILKTQPVLFEMQILDLLVCTRECVALEQHAGLFRMGAQMLFSCWLLTWLCDRAG